MLNIKPKVTLVGAGPGDPDLLTLKGAKALAEANVVLYDALANDEILAYAPKKSIKIFVGKKIGNHTYTQDQINQLIVDNALTYGNVVRLKGGDPFIFGRGSEEIEFIESFGIETVVVPGISSVVAVPASQGISITKSGVSESFWAITGTTSDRKLSADVALAAQSSATVVILMGMHKLPQIIDLFQKEDKGEFARCDHSKRNNIRRKSRRWNSRFDFRNRKRAKNELTSDYCFGRSCERKQ